MSGGRPLKRFTLADRLEQLVARVEMVERRNEMPQDVAAATGADWRPFPNVPISCAGQAWQKWPGGVRVLQATAWNDLGSDISSGFASNRLTTNFVRYTVNHNAGSGGLSGAPTVFTIRPGDMDVDTSTDPGSGGGPGGRRYELWVRARCTTTGIDGLNVYMGVSQSELTDTTNFINTSQDLPTTGGRWGLYGPVQLIARPGNDVEVRFWRDGEADFTLEVELIYLFPMGVIEDPYTGANVQKAGDEWIPADNPVSGTVTFPTDYDSGYASFADMMEDTQVIDHILSGGLVWSGYDSNGNLISFRQLDLSDRADINTPMHHYLALRPGGFTGIGCATLARGGVPVGTALVWNSAWAFYYLGLTNPVYDSTELALWLPTDDTSFQPYDTPASAVRAGNGHIASTLLDYESGGRGPTP